MKVVPEKNIDWYRWALTNNYERAVFFKEDVVGPREATRYMWAAKNLVGNKVLEIGCSNGYGVQFFPHDTQYIGLDYDPLIVEVAKLENWSASATFQQADINTYPLEQYDTIIAFEVIEHLDNGLEIVKKLQQHCKCLLITVPYYEPVGFWGPHHKLHGLNESHFSGFEFWYINELGYITKQPQAIDQFNRCNLMVCKWIGDA